jgi:hypothetical protein
MTRISCLERFFKEEEEEDRRRILGQGFCALRKHCAKNMLTYYCLEAIHSS